MSHKEARPRYFDLAKNPGCHKTNPFTQARAAAAALGLTLERSSLNGCKYILTGDLDLGPAGVECRILDDVYNELDNYG